MFDIMRFQFRQLLRTKVVHLTYFLLLAVSLLVLFIDSSNYGDVRLKMTEYLPRTLPILVCVAIFVPVITVGLVCGADFEDKTINYELSAGRSRAASYFGRAVPVLITAPAMTAAVLAVPYIIFGMNFGIGDAIPVSYIVQRFLLMLFPLLRLCAFCVFLMFITKKQIVVVAASLLTSMISLAITSGYSAAPIITVIQQFRGMLSISDLVFLCSFDSWRAYDLRLHSFYTYYPAIPGSDIAALLVFSLVMTAVWLLLGYHFFHVDDMN